MEVRYGQLVKLLDETIRFNQILIVLLLASRKGVKTELEIKSFQSLVENVNNAVDGSVFLASQPGYY